MYAPEEVDQAIDQYLELMAVRNDPIKLAQKYFAIDPNEGQTTFLIELQVENILGHLLQTCRGGGKTLIAAIAIIWAALKYEKFKGLILSGAFEQAKTFYSYVKAFIDQCPPLLEKIEGEPLQSETRFKDGGFIKVLTASERSTRSPHVDMLIIDEFVIVKPDLIDSAFATVRTSKHPKRIFLTTASQTQACVSIDRWYDYWDHAVSYGFRTYQWGVDQCDWISKQDLELARKILDPFIFETEYLGLRVGRRGAVFKEEQIMTAVRTANQYQYIPEFPTIAGIDWGFYHDTVCTVIQPQQGGQVNLVVHVEGHPTKDMNWWALTLEELAHKYNIQAFYCDASHTFNNRQLSNMDLPIASVAFVKYKERMIGEMRRKLEHQLIKIPEHFDKTISQLKSYSYDPKTEKPIKENDDFVDSICLASWGCAQGDLFSIGRFM